MAKLIYAALLLAVWYGGVNGDAECFMYKTLNCIEKVAVAYPPEETDILFCKFHKELFACIRRSSVECSDYQRHMEINHMEKVYNDFCRDGSVLNLEMKKHKECISNSVTSSLSCIQDIVDFAKHIKELTPDLIKEFVQLTCRERSNINKCNMRNVHEHCGEEAKDVFNILVGASERLNELTCKDILNE